VLLGARLQPPWLRPGCHGGTATVTKRPLVGSPGFGGGHRDPDRGGAHGDIDSNGIVPEIDFVSSTVRSMQNGEDESSSWILRENLAGLHEYVTTLARRSTANA
jgi:hypothetical protein